MDVARLDIPDVIVITPTVHHDERGLFFESFNQRVFEDITGCDGRFVQDNHSRSTRGVLRGLHYQLGKAQGKLVRVVRGEIYDVAVDIRKNSPTFGRWIAEKISSNSNSQLWIPPGFAHGFYVISEVADVIYKTTEYYSPGDEHAIHWDDPDLAIEWPFSDSPIVSKKDAAAALFKNATL